MNPIIAHKTFMEFMRVLDILSKPEEAKKILVQFNERQKALEAHEEELASREADVSSRSAQADLVLANERQNKDRYDIEMRKANELQATVQMTKTQLDKEREELKVSSQNLEGLKADCANKLKELEQREVKIKEGEIDLEDRKQKLDKAEAELKAKLDQLRGIVK